MPFLSPNQQHQSSKDKDLSIGDCEKQAMIEQKFSRGLFSAITIG